MKFLFLCIFFLLVCKLLVGIFYFLFLSDYPGSPRLALLSAEPGNWGLKSEVIKMLLLKKDNTDGLVAYTLEDLFKFRQLWLAFAHKDYARWEKTLADRARAHSSRRSSNSIHARAISCKYIPSVQERMG